MEAIKRPAKLPKVSIWQFINLCIGGIGLQFAWAMQIGLTSRVTEPLGATPLILGLIWLAGPITGILVQPIVGTLSDNIWTKFGRRRPFLLTGAILGAVALIAMPYAPTLLIAAASLWIIDICVNVSMGPHRALVPDTMPSEQHALANSFFSFGAGLGAIIVYGFPYFLKTFFHQQISIHQQFLIAAIVLVIGMGWTCFTVKEKYLPEEKKKEDVENPFEAIKMFLISGLISAVILTFLIIFGVLGKFDLSNKDFIINILSWFVLILSFPMLAMALKSFYTKEIAKICAMQYFTWIGMMCLFIYFNNFVVHNVFLIPDLTTATEAMKKAYDLRVMEATNLSGLGFAFFNAVCFIVSIPLGLLCNKFGKKNIHSLALLTMGLAFLGFAFLTKSKGEVLFFMALAGIRWASILTLSYALLMDNLKKGTEGSSLGKMNLFVSGPQILSSIAVGYLINKSPMQIQAGTTNHWEYAFIVAGITMFIASAVAFSIKRETAQQEETQFSLEDESLVPAENI